MEISDIKRGDIFLVNTEYNIDTKGWIQLPFLVIQNDIGNKYSPTLIMVAITSKLGETKLPMHVKLPREISGLEQDSIVLAEQIRTYSKKRLKAKIGELNSKSKYMRMVEIAILLSIGHLFRKDEEAEFSFGNIEEDYKRYIEELTKPLIITEGKTDVIIIKTAWEKLYPNKNMYFECISSGVQVDEEKRSGGATTLRQALNNISTIENRPIIGLFDNDRRGNMDFNGFKKEIFKSDDIKYNIKKHIARNIWAMLLPVPEERELFVTKNDIDQRYFVIEHYFSDEVLKELGMYGDNILGTSVFKINGGKDNFSKKAKELDVKEFKNFHILFKEIDDIFKSI